MEDREGTLDKSGMGRSKDHGAATVQRNPHQATAQVHTPPASPMKERTPPAEVRTTPSETMKVRAMPKCTARRDRVIQPHAHGSVGRQVGDNQDNTRGGGLERLGLARAETRRGMWWTT